jgi:hypothetical protein
MTTSAVFGSGMVIVTVFSFLRAWLNAGFNAELKARVDESIE